MQLSGVYTALVTPFREGSVDLEAWRALVDRQLEAGVAGLVPCGTTGETPTLSQEEWSALVSIAVERSDARVPVIAGCGTNSTATTVDGVARARALGADAALVVFPYYNKPNPAGLRAHVEAAARVGLPLVLYHVPGRTGQRIGTELLAELCNIPGVVGLKEATGDLVLGEQLLQRTDRALLSGDDFTFAPFMVMGGAGVISVLSNVAPRMTVAWAAAAASGDLSTFRALQKRLMPLVHYLFAEVNPVPCKAAMAMMGLCENELRLPLAPGRAPAAELLQGLE
jgi:4-hydroxy-tetrahydrodipicolinate synthase